MNKRLVLIIVLTISSWAWSETYLFADSDITKQYFPKVEQIVREIMQTTDNQLELINLPGERAKRQLLMNQLDGHLIRVENYGDFVPNAVRVDPPIAILQIYGLVPVSSEIQKLSELAGKTMGFNLGIAAHSLVAEKYNAIQVPVAEIDKTLLMVASNRLDFTAVSKNMGDDFIATGAQVRMLPEPIFELNFHIWLAEKNKDLVEEWSQALEALTEEGMTPLR
jgi:ABC-type amino acid transport substrate-binding protein